MFKWHYFDQVYSRFTRDGKMAFFTSQTRPLRRETLQRRQPEVFLAVISLPLAVTDVCRRRILSRLFSGRRQLQPDVTSSFVGYCACSYLPPCRRGPVGDVKLGCLALWRKREYLTSISKFCRLSFLNCPCFL